ncbi:MAG: NFACT family protein, partial [Tissierellia bacterium]|nr:NFACT family protein [Tissierellia bacterium]
MSYDGLMLHAVKDELQKDILGGKIDRIYQQEKDEILLHIRTYSHRYLLLLSASGNNPRIYKTNYKKDNPQEPPMFCMVLRKHLIGSRIIDILQYEMDRILKIKLECRNELGDLQEKSLMIEIMGRHSNIIFINEEDNHIIDAIKKVNASMSSVREILPGKIYNPTPLGSKINPLTVEKKDIIHYLSQNPKNENGIRFLMNTFTGISPLISRELLYRARIDETLPLSAWEDIQKESLAKEMIELFLEVKRKNYSFETITDHDIFAFSAISLKQFPEGIVTKYDSASKMLEDV